MTQLGEAVARYHKLIESESYRNLDWARELQAKMLAANLKDGARPICPFLRPHFLSLRQHAALVKAADALCSAIDRIKQMALANPALLARLQLLPAEKMLATIDPGYPFLAVTSLLDTHLNGGGLHFVGYNADTAPGVTYGAVLADLFFDCPPMRQFRRQYRLTKLGGGRHLVSSVLSAYKHFRGKQKPRIGVMEFRQAFQAAEPSDYVLLCEAFRGHGLEAQLVSPDQLEYKGGVLRQGAFAMDLVFRRVKIHEFLLRFDLSHPLVRAYRDRAVCVVNSFRSELAHKRSIFALLSDETLTSSFPAAERNAIQQYVPWTRVVAPASTQYKGKMIDLQEFIVKNRQNLVLKPNDDSGEEHIVQGWMTDDAGWDRALRLAARTPHVVQEKVEPVKAVFPLLRYGSLEMRELQVDVHPHAYLGKVQGCSSWVSETASGGFSSVAGLAPTYILEPRS
ncbi:MAG TPA: hypothetical protein VLH09_01800 [Bryobacteraceae bacterium]|nr:hypothetical protein [Bryobacteraceae bacterium]